MSRLDDFYDLELSAHHEHLRAAYEIGPGDQVLDIGCGTGQTTREAGRAAAPARVFGIDVSEPMLERARQMTEAERLDNVHYELGDAQLHPFDPAGFDVAISRFGTMFFSDPIAAFVGCAGDDKKPAVVCAKVGNGEVDNRYRTGNSRKDRGADMTTNNAQRSVLLIGKSQLVLDDSVAGLRDLGYKAAATNDFTDITGRFDISEIDLVVFGGQVPPDLKDELRQEIGAINPRVIFVQGLAGIPGLIINQVQGAFSADKDPAGGPRFTPDKRSIVLTLTEPADVKVTAWWQTSFVPPDPKSESLLLLDDRLAAGDHTIPVPDLVPPQAAFATVQAGAAIYAFSIATEQ